MPIIQKSKYVAPPFFGNGHIQTLFPRLFRQPKPVNYQRSRIETPDGDFLDLDYARVGGKKGVILLHGLEGNTHRHYMTGMAWALNRRGLDVIAMNLRGCGGEPNRKLRLYHQGATEDLHTVIEHVLAHDDYRSLALAGFSLGEISC